MSWNYNVNKTSLAPLLDVVEYEEVEFTNDFAHQTKYRGPPTFELEAEWKKLWFCMSIQLRFHMFAHHFQKKTWPVVMLIQFAVGGIQIPADKMSALNRSAETQPWKPTADGKGYHALIEVFHQLHCLVNLALHQLSLEYS